MNVLVAYASRHGATRGIAERIALVIRQAGHDVGLAPVGDIGDIEGYDALVVGSAAYLGGWLDEATSFVRRHRRALEQRPVWLFSSGPIGRDKVDARGRDQIEASAPKEFAEFSRTIRPRGVQVFFGAYDPDAPAVGLAESLMSRFMRIVPATRNALPVGDFRDWGAIEAWAASIAEELGAPVLEPVGAG